MGSATTPTVVSIATMPTSMTDAEATRMGLKTYSHGTTYTGSPNSPTVTGVNVTGINSSSFMPYQKQDGTWWLKFNVWFTSSAQHTVDFNVAGILFTGQSVSTYSCNASLANTASTGRTSINDNLIYCRSYSTGFTGTSWTVSSDAPLASKPTWAY
jgi:hypothetical protein